MKKISAKFVICVMALIVFSVGILTGSMYALAEASVAEKAYERDDFVDDTFALLSADKTPDKPANDVTPAELDEDVTPAAPVEEEIPAVSTEEEAPALPAEDEIPAALAAVPAEEEIPAAPVWEAIPDVPEEEEVPALPAEEKIPPTPVEEEKPAVSSEEEKPAVPAAVSAEEEKPAEPSVDPIVTEPTYTLTSDAGEVLSHRIQTWICSCDWLPDEIREKYESNYEHVSLLTYTSIGDKDSTETLMFVGIDENGKTKTETVTIEIPAGQTVFYDEKTLGLKDVPGFVIIAGTYGDVRWESGKSKADIMAWFHSKHDCSTHQ